MNDHEDEPTESVLVAELDRLAGVVCRDCGRAICGHAVLCSVALGFKNAPRCPTCLAAGLRRDASALVEQVADYVQRRDCYRRAWDVACDREGLPRSPRPACIASDQTIGTERNDEVPPTAPPVILDWDAGAMACGDLVLALRLKMRELPSGGAIRVTATDPAAPLDLPAWCRLTGQRLLQAEHPVYLIQRSDGYSSSGS